MCSCGPLLAHFVFFFHSPDLIRDNTTHLTIQILCCVTSLYDLFMTTQEGCPLVFIGSSQHMSHQHFSVLFNAFQSFTPAEKTSSFICINHIQMLEYHTKKKKQNCSNLSWNTKDEKTRKQSDCHDDRRWALWMSRKAMTQMWHQPGFEIPFSALWYLAFWDVCGP